MLFVILGMLFIGIGDSILPQPLSDYSRNIRKSINNYLLGLFPQRKFNDPNQSTQEQFQQREEEGLKGN